MIVATDNFLSLFPSLGVTRYTFVCPFVDAPTLHSSTPLQQQFPAS